MNSIHRQTVRIISGISAIAIIFVILVGAIVSLGLFALIYKSATINPIVIQTQSGLETFDSLSTGNISSWTFNGDAVTQKAIYTHFENSTGLYIGVKAAKSGEWAGYYGVTAGGNAIVFQAKVSLPQKSISSGAFNSGLYVQTAEYPVNYVSCGAGMTPKGSYWQVVVGRGNVTLASNFNVLYFQSMTGEPLTKTCTIITNGINLLTVYIGSARVYSNTTMNLNMPQPFNSYFLVDSTTTSQILFGSFSDYSATLGTNMTVNNAPAGGSVELVGALGNVLYTAGIGSDGSASIQLPLNGTLTSGYVKVYSSIGNLVASDSQINTFWGGDVYSLRSSL